MIDDRNLIKLNTFSPLICFKYEIVTKLNQHKDISILFTKVSLLSLKTIIKQKIKFYRLESIHNNHKVVLF